MAVQFESVPSTNTFQSTADPIIIQVSESVVATYFKYRFILEVKDEDDVLLAKLKTHMLSASNQVAVFDISRVVDDYLGSTSYNTNDSDASVITLGRTGHSPVNIIGLAPQNGPHTVKNISLKAYYEDAVSAAVPPVEDDTGAVTTTVRCFRNEFINHGENFGDRGYEFQLGVSTANFMSSAPDLGVVSGFGSAWGNVREHRIGTDQAAVISWSNDVGTSRYVIIRGFEADGTVIATANIDTLGTGGVTGVTADYQRVYQMGVGPLNLEEHATASSNTNLTSIITDADLAYYEIYTSNTTAVASSFQDSIVHRWTIDEGCSIYPRVQLMFLNRHSGWDCFNFDQKSEESLTGIERTTYNRPRGNWDNVSTSVDWTYYGWERGTSVTSVKAERQMRISSDYVDEGYKDQLRDIATSREVYIVDGDNLIPVVVTDSEYLFKTSANDKLISYSFTLRYANRPRLK